MRVCIETFGCTVNQADSEVLARLLLDAGHEIVGGEDEAEVAVVNTCSVKSTTERKVLRRLAAIRCPVVVAGCLARADPEAVRAARPDAALLGPRELDRVADAVASLATGGARAFLGHRRLDKSVMAKERTERFTARIPIAEGCLGACSYCQTRIARGPLFSFPREHLIDEAQRAIAEGCRELLLTAQDTAAYGADTGRCSLADLVADIARLQGEFRVRIGMCNPDLAAPQLDALLAAMEGGKVYRFLHLPVQSGSDRVLAHMGRRYTRDGFLALVRRCREALADFQLATDVIVGYPTEDDEDFAQTLDLLQEARPAMINVTRFSPRRGTPAAGLAALPGAVLRERSRAASDLAREVQLSEMRRLVGSTMRVLVRGPGPKEGGLLARSDAYRLVALPRGEVGAWAWARITGAAPTYLRGELLDRGPDEA